MVERPNRRFVIGAMVGVLASLGVALIAQIPDRAPAPAKVTVIPAAPVVVPMPITVAPPVAEAVILPPPPPVRAATPFLQAQCLYGEDAPDVDRATCDWDDGFPAIAADGKTIVVKHTDEDGGRGNPNLRIEFFDVATGKRLRSVKILDGDEYDTTKYDALLLALDLRIAKLNAQLDGYRTLATLDNIEEQNLEGTRLRVDRHDSIVRIVDTDSQRAIYHRNFAASVVYPNHKSDPDRECSGLAQLGDISVWWDETTRTLVSAVFYAYGGCMCDGQTDTFVKRVP